MLLFLACFDNNGVVRQDLGRAAMLYDSVVVRTLHGDRVGEVGTYPRLRLEGDKDAFNTDASESPVR